MSRSTEDERFEEQAEETDEVVKAAGHLGTLLGLLTATGDVRRIAHAARHMRGGPAPMSV